MITAAETRAHIFELVGAGLSVDHNKYDLESIKPLALEITLAIQTHIRTIADSRWTPEYANAMEAACGVICGILVANDGGEKWSEMALMASQTGLI